MKTETSIRVIKRGRGDGKNAEAALKSDETATARSAVRATVSSWVREFQQQRRKDPKRAFRSLFEEQASHPPTG